MASDVGPLFAGEGAALAQHPAGHHQLADVVEQRSGVEPAKLPRFQPELCPYPPAICGNSLGVTSGVDVLRLDHRHEGRNRRMTSLIGAPSSRLGGSGDQQPGSDDGSCRPSDTVTDQPEQPSHHPEHDGLGRRRSRIGVVGQLPSQAADDAPYANRNGTCDPGPHNHDPGRPLAGACHGDERRYRGNVGGDAPGDDLTRPSGADVDHPARCGGERSRKQRPSRGQRSRHRYCCDPSGTDTTRGLGLDDEIHEREPQPRPQRSGPVLKDRDGTSDSRCCGRDEKNVP